LLSTSPFTFSGTAGATTAAAVGGVGVGTTCEGACAKGLATGLMVNPPFLAFDSGTP